MLRFEFSRIDINLYTVSKIGQIRVYILQKDSSWLSFIHFIYKMSKPNPSEQIKEIKGHSSHSAHFPVQFLLLFIVDFWFLLLLLARLKPRLDQTAPGQVEGTSWRQQPQ